MSRTVLLGGTFDPPHIGHLFLAECARIQLQADRVVFMPAGNPWRKAHREVTAGHHRLEMTRLAVRDHFPFEVDDREMRRAGPTYTVETLEEMHAEHDRELILVLGTDALADMPNWHEGHRIPELAEVVIALKALPPEDLPSLARAAGLPRTPEIIDMPRLAISSTLIRDRVAAGKTVRYLVPHAVDSYIRAEGLYRAPSATAAAVR